MSLLTSPFSTGRLIGTVYTFEKIGDTLPMHTHGEGDVHITIVARGKVLIHGPTIGSTIYEAGAVIDWAPEIYHEFIGKEDNSRVVHIIKGVPDAKANS